MKENIHSRCPATQPFSTPPPCTDQSIDIRSLVGLHQHVVLLPMSALIDAPCLLQEQWQLTFVTKLLLLLLLALLTRPCPVPVPCNGFHDRVLLLQWLKISSHTKNLLLCSGSCFQTLRPCSPSANPRWQYLLLSNLSTRCVMNSFNSRNNSNLHGMERLENVKYPMSRWWKCEGIHSWVI